MLLAAAQACEKLLLVCSMETRLFGKRLQSHGKRGLCLDGVVREWITSGRVYGLTYTAANITHTLTKHRRRRRQALDTEESNMPLFYWVLFCNRKGLITYFSSCQKKDGIVSHCYLVFRQGFEDAYTFVYLIINNSWFIFMWQRVLSYLFIMFALSLQ